MGADHLAFSNIHSSYPYGSIHPLSISHLIPVRLDPAAEGKDIPGCAFYLLRLIVMLFRFRFAERPAYSHCQLYTAIQCFIVYQQAVAATNECLREKNSDPDMNKLDR